MLNVDTAKIPILFSAKIPEIFAKIPINEKSRTPWMRKDFQPFSYSIVSFGVSSVLHTKDISSAVFDRKKISFFKSNY